MGLQSAKKSDKEELERQLKQQKEEPVEPNQNMIQQLEQRFEVNLDDMDMDDIVPGALEKDFMHAGRLAKDGERPS